MKHISKYIAYSFPLFLLNVCLLFSQPNNENIRLQKSATNEDTVFVFTSPRPLLSDAKMQAKRNSIGLEILFSGSGLGVGCQMERTLSPDYKLNWGLFFSSKRISDEIEYYDNNYNTVIPYKVNRLYTVPINFGIQRYVNLKDLGKTFRPFAEVMAGPALIWQVPYYSDFFSDLKYSKLHLRPSIGVAIGADFGAIATSFISFKLKYLYTPYGGNGLESMQDLPIHNFGGFFLSLTLGSYY